LQEDGQNYAIVSFVISLFTKWTYSDQIIGDGLGDILELYGEMTNAYEDLVWKSERKSLLGAPGGKWEDELDVNEI
jgi:hypothetical protein